MYVRKYVVLSGCSMGSYIGEVHSWSWAVVPSSISARDEAGTAIFQFFCVFDV